MFKFLARLKSAAPALVNMAATAAVSRTHTRCCLTHSVYHSSSIFSLTKKYFYVSHFNKASQGGVVHNIAQAVKDITGAEGQVDVPSKSMLISTRRATKTVVDEAVFKPPRVRLAGLGATIDILFHNIVEYEPGKFSA